MKYLNRTFIILFFFNITLFSQSEGKQYYSKDDSLILLKTNPEDVYVYLRDSLIGHTPLKLEQGFSTLILQKDGYEQKVLALNDLRKDEIVNLHFIGINKKDSFFNRPVFKYLLGGIIALGAATAYFKIKADKNFDEYEFSGNRSYLDKTKRFDTISGITFGVLQVNFGVLIYHFLTE
ncbi:MAG TPA: PEGA domain-containing protein [Ignavibacteriaceae bacterium]|nr:PEGA domain-containing protein [Ignavibacteriaceae bacterium]